MSARNWNTRRNGGGVHLRTWTILEVEAPGNMGVAHRDHLLALVREYAKSLGLRTVVAEQRAEGELSACGYRWEAPYLWPPGVPPGTFFVPGLGNVVTDRRSQPQRCCLPKGHDGPHRSQLNVITAGEGEGE